MTTPIEIPINIIFDENTYLAYDDYIIAENEHFLEENETEENINCKKLTPPMGCSLFAIDNNTVFRDENKTEIVLDEDKDRIFFSTRFYMEMINKEEFYIFVKTSNGGKFYFGTFSMDIVQFWDDDDIKEYDYRDRYRIEDDKIITVPRKNKKFVLNSGTRYLSLINIDHASKYPEEHAVLKLKRV